jgi:hypothetical protein
MGRIKELLIFRGVPIAMGWVAVHYWGSDTRNREVIVFVLAMFVTHCVLSVFSVASSVDNIADRLAARRESGALQ